jgi:hypothetical protein
LLWESYSIEVVEVESMVTMSMESMKSRRKMDERIGDMRGYDVTTVINEMQLFYGLAAFVLKQTGTADE